MNKDFFKFIIENFKLDLDGIHGINHWLRVYYFGMLIAEHNKACKKVIFYFAFLHDFKRKKDFDDEEHGLRVANFLDKIRNTFLKDLNDKEFFLLKKACAIHSITCAKVEDETIKTCLDADRLDLGRAEIIPDPKYLYTDFAKKDDVIKKAVILSQENFKPNFFEKEINEILNKLKIIN